MNATPKPDYSQHPSQTVRDADAASKVFAAGGGNEAAGKIISWVKDSANGVLPEGIPESSGPMFLAMALGRAAAQLTAQNLADKLPVKNPDQVGLTVMELEYAGLMIGTYECTQALLDAWINDDQPNLGALALSAQIFSNGFRQVMDDALVAKGYVPSEKG